MDGAMCAQPAQRVKSGPADPAEILPPEGARRATPFLRDVFPAELAYVAERRRAAGSVRAATPEGPPTTRHDLIGLALSGGGIRSATWSLGILQALHRRGVLPHVDYLSTVSGGGFIGAALTALTRRKG